MSLSISFQIHPCCYKWQIFIFYGWVVFYCMSVYVTYTYTHTSHLLYPFICCWTRGYFHILAIVNNLLWTVGFMYSFEYWFLVFFGCILRSELLDHMVALFLVFWGSFILFSVVPVAIYISTNSVGGVPFLHILTNICYLHTSLCVCVCVCVC